MQIIKHTTLAWLTFAGLAAGPAFAQDAPPAVPPPLATPAEAPPAPPAPPIPPAPPTPRAHGLGPMLDGPHGPLHDGPLGLRHREPVTFLGVGVEPVPPALVDQLNLPEGFGLIAAYVVPGSPAEKAGIKTHDVLKSLNDQTLVSPDQLATLVRSFKEGQDVSLTLMRKGQETKVSVKLEKKALPALLPLGDMEDHHGAKMPFKFKGHRDDDDDDDDDDNGMDFSFNDDEKPAHGKHAENDQAPPAPAPPIRDILRELRPQIEEIKKAARQEVEQGLRREITILRQRDGASRTTKLDLGRARIVVRDDSGELSLKIDDGKSTLVAKDTDGKVLFSGSVDTEDQRKAMPSDVRERLEKLEREQMPDVPAAPEAPKPPKSPREVKPRGPAVPFMR